MNALIQIARRELLDASEIAAQNNKGQLAAKFMAWSNDPALHSEAIAVEAASGEKWSARMLLAQKAIVSAQK